MKTCPACGKTNKPIAKECEYCGAPLEDKKFDFDADQAKLDAANVGLKRPGAPAAPGAGPKTPGAPKAPGAPVAPGAPKPPSAPGA